MTKIILAAALLLVAVAGCDHDGCGGIPTPPPDMSAQSADASCGVIAFCLPYLAADTRSFALCAFPEANRTSAGKAYADCVIASVSGSCSAACTADRADGGNPC